MACGARQGLKHLTNSIHRGAKVLAKWPVEPVRGSELFSQSISIKK